MAKIEGAIFDLDGTIVDSMPMWIDVMREITLESGLDFTQELMDTYESCTVPEACALLHDKYGVKASAEEIENEIHRLVADAYAHSVKAIPGSLDFIHSLEDAGIPCVIASSTPSRLASICLEAQGIRSAFKAALSAGEVRDHRDKEFPDVYLEALSILGRDQDEVWVFEDAPFAVRTARRAGFHVVGIHNAGDGRDPEFTKRWVDIFSEHYTNVSLEKILAFDDAVRNPIPEA